MARDEEERELDDDLDDDLEDDAFDGAALETELESELIEEWCPICKDIKPHAVVGNGKIACAVCNHEHHRETESTGTPIIRSLLTADDEASPEALKAAWERLTAIDDSEIKPYSIRLKLSDGDVIRHSKFGIGIVVEMTDMTKAEVLFSDGLRRLVCGK